MMAHTNKDGFGMVQPPLPGDEAVDIEGDEALGQGIPVRPGEGGGYRYVCVNAAHKGWWEGGRPDIDSDHPLSKVLLEGITQYATYDTHGFVEGNNKNAHLTTDDGRNNLNVRAARDKVNRERLIQRKIARAKRALNAYTPNHAAGASFATFLKKPFDHADVDELRHVMKPPIQKELRECFGQGLDDEIHAVPERDFDGRTIRPERYLPKKLKPLARWIAEQPDELKITWRMVAKTFPDHFGSEDKAQRALKAIKAWFARVRDRRFKRRR